MRGALRRKGGTVVPQKAPVRGANGSMVAASNRKENGARTSMQNAAPRYGAAKAAAAREMKPAVKF